METTELVAGRALDALIAEKVVRLRLFFPYRGHPEWLADPSMEHEPWYECVINESNSVLPVPFYSTNAAAAFLLVDRYWSVSMEKCDSVDPPWHVCIWARQGDEPFAEARGATFPEAMCRAALEAADDRA